MKFSDHVTYKPTDEYYKVISDWEKEHPDWWYLTGAQTMVRGESHEQLKAQDWKFLIRRFWTWEFEFNPVAYYKIKNVNFSK